MDLVATAHEQDIMKWRWHELDEARRRMDFSNFGMMLLHSMVIDMIETEYAFLWN